MSTVAQYFWRANSQVPDSGLQHINLLNNSRYSQPSVSVGYISTYSNQSRIKNIFSKFPKTCIFNTNVPTFPSKWLFIICMHACMLSCFSCISVFVTPSTEAWPGFSVHGILLARILEWVALPSYRGSSWPKGQTHVL